ncbi:MAG: HAD-IA family hydrolase, partial [Woeseia sp.]
LYTHFRGRIFSAYEYDSWKPDPGLFLAAAKHFGVAPTDCIVIEDSFVGVSAGVAAKMTVLGLSSTAGSASLAAAHRIFESLHEIHEFFVTQNLSRE